MNASFSGFVLLAFFEAIAVAVHLGDVNVMSKAIEQGAGEPLGAENLGPLVERQITVTFVAERSSRRLNQTASRHRFFDQR